MCLCRGCAITHTNSRVGSEDKIVQGSNVTGLTVPGHNVKIHYAPEPSLLFKLYHLYRLYQPYYVYLYLHTHIPTLMYEYHELHSMLRVYTRYQENVNSLWITPNPYSMIHTLPWVTPGTPANSVSVTVINSSNWDKRESSTWVCKQLWEGLHLRLDYNQSRTISGITVVYSVWCW